MSTTTTNYGLVKPELTDAADITAMNENWDKIDEELKEHADHTHTASDVGARPDTWMPTASQVGALSDKGGTLSGNLKLLRGNSPTIEMKVLSDNGYTSMYQHGGTFTTSSGMSSDSDESFMVLTKPSEDDDSSIFRIGRTINNSSKYYKLYGEHNKPTASDVGAVPIDGVGGVHNIKTYTSLAQIGITKGEETLEAISRALPAGSILTYEIGNEYNLSIYGEKYGGTFYAEKTFSDRMRVEYVRYSKNAVWYGFVYNHTTFTGWQQDLPTDGSVPMSGELTQEINGQNAIRLKNTYNNVWNTISVGADNAIIMFSDKNKSQNVYLTLTNNTTTGTDILKITSDIVGVKHGTFNIFGEHNKPSGSYTGNGSATQRKIATGSMGNVYIVYNMYAITFVTPNGSLVVPSSGTIKYTTEIYTTYPFDGSFVVESASDFHNKTGSVYTYISL